MFIHLFLYVYVGPAFAEYRLFIVLTDVAKPPKRSAACALATLALAHGHWALQPKRVWVRRLRVYGQRQHASAPRPSLVRIDGLAPMLVRTGTRVCRRVWGSPAGLLEHNSCGLVAVSCSDWAQARSQSSVVIPLCIACGPGKIAIGCRASNAESLLQIFLAPGARWRRLFAKVSSLAAASWDICTEELPDPRSSNPRLDRQHVLTKVSTVSDTARFARHLE